MAKLNFWEQVSAANSLAAKTEKNNVALPEKGLSTATYGIQWEIPKPIGHYGVDEYGNKTYTNADGQLYVYNTKSGDWQLQEDIKIEPNDTQKVRGIRLLARLRNDISYVGDAFGLSDHPFKVFSLAAKDSTQIPISIRNALDTWRSSSDLFARPCPESPTHGGFIESRRIRLTNRHLNSVYAELRELYDEVLAHDPKGQLLLMPYVKAAYNLVLANGTVTIGAYHDGATANRKAIVLPTAAINVSESLRKDAGIDSEPFIELVAEKDHHHFARPRLVQLRNGPALPRSKDFLPFAVDVRNVVCVTKHTNVEELDKTPSLREKGSVVYCGDGGLNSHAGVHCALNGVPFITSRLPLVGERWEQTSTEKAPCNREAFLRGLNTATIMRLSTIEWPGVISNRSACESMLFILHSLPYADLSDKMNARLFGMACGFGVRLGMTACLGEARYGKQDKANRKVLKPYNKTVDGLSREQVYTTAMSIPFDEMVSRFAEALPAFGWSGWSNISENVGGVKWHVCGLLVAKLWNVIVSYCNGNEASATDCATALNRVVNVAHNSNRLLTKFATPSVFDIASSDNLPFVSLRNVGPLYRFAMERVPLLKHEPPKLQALDMEAIGPQKSDVLQVVLESLPQYRRDRMERYCSSYADADISFDKEAIMEALGEEQRRYDEKVAAMRKDIRAAFSGLLARHKDSLPLWPKTNDGCFNCENSPLPGSYASWHPKLHKVTLDPCCACNGSIYNLHQFVSVVIDDPEIPLLYKAFIDAKAALQALKVEKEPEESEQESEEIPCIEPCDDCGACMDGDCTCPQYMCECKVECPKCGVKHRKIYSHECHPCKWSCDVCKGCRNACCGCGKKCCSCPCLKCGKTFNEPTQCKHEVNSPTGKK